MVVSADVELASLSQSHGRQSDRAVPVRIQWSMHPPVAVGRECCRRGSATAEPRRGTSTDGSERLRLAETDKSAMMILRNRWSWRYVPSAAGGSPRRRSLIRPRRSLKAATAVQIRSALPVLAQVRGLTVGNCRRALIICHWLVIASGHPSAAPGDIGCQRPLCLWSRDRRSCELPGCRSPPNSHAVRARRPGRA